MSLSNSLHFNPGVSERPIERLPYYIEVFDARYPVVEVLALAAHLAVGRAAYRAAIINIP